MDEIHTMIFGAVFFSIIYGSFWLFLLMSALYLPIRAARRAQLKLEKVYMGPEIVRPAIPARSAIVVPQQQGVIHYVAAPAVDLEASSSGRVITAAN